MLPATLLRRSAALVPRRSFSAAPRLLAGASGKNVPTPLGEGHIESVHGMPEPVYDNVPGFSTPGKLASNYEVAVGIERYELLQRLDGKVAFETSVPVYIDRKPTRKDPLIVKGIDHEAYIGCTGFPAESHEPTWLVLKSNGYVYRCPSCGCAYKYEDVSGGHSHH